MNENDSKRPIESKTLMFNMLVAVLAVVADQSETVRGLLSPGGYLALTMVIALVNTWLRWQTTVPIKTKRQLAQEQGGE